jgi:hypothetical protein
LGYVDSSAKALPDEPEAVSASCQQRLSELGHRRDRERRIAAFTITSETINGALDAFVARVGHDPRLAHGVRAVRRTTAALGREVGVSSEEFGWSDARTGDVLGVSHDTIRRSRPANADAQAGPARRVGKDGRLGSGEG